MLQEIEVYIASTNEEISFTNFYVRRNSFYLPKHGRTGIFGLGGGGGAAGAGGGDLIARKNYTMPESMCCTNPLKSQ